MGDIPDVDIVDEVKPAAGGKTKKEPKPKLIKVKLDPELVKRRNYCERCMNKASERFKEEVGVYKIAAEDTELEVQLLQMQVQSELGITFEQAAKEGKIGADEVKRYSALSAANIEKQRKLNNVLRDSPKLKHLKAWRDLKDELEEEIAAKANVDLDDIDWKKGEAEVVEGEDFGSMKDQLQSLFEDKLKKDDGEADQEGAA